MAPVFTPAHRGGAGEPLLLLHGFTDTWRTWELVLPALEQGHDVLAPTLAGHAGGPPLPDPTTDAALLDAIERTLDDAGWATTHVAGNSLGGYLALRLATRGRARSVVALAPAGGWAEDDRSFADTLAYFAEMHEATKRVAPFAERVMATPEGRRRATASTSVGYEHIPPELLVHQLTGAAACTGTRPLIEAALRDGYHVDAEQIACPVRIIWGTEDRLLPWPSAAARYRRDLPHADWVVLDGVGHSLQLDVPLETAQLILGATRAR